MKLGATTIGGLYLGSTAINAAYLGATQVFSAGTPPSELDILIATLQSGAAQLIAHPLEYGSMFQDRAGTIPVTASGQVVGQVLDVGGGSYHATAISDPARGIFRDVDGKRWVEYNGTNTAYQTPTLPAPGVDKAQVFAGVRKLSDSTTRTLIELSPSLALNAGVFSIFAPVSAGPNYTLASKGSSQAVTTSPSTFASPITNVLTGLCDISGDSAALRIDGTQVSIATGPQGAGNYNPSGTYRIYYGARAGTSLFFNGRHYATLGPIVRFSAANATTEQIDAAEAYYTARVV